MATFTATFATIVSVNKRNTKRGLRYQIVTSTGRTHWTSIKFMQDALMSSDLEAMSPAEAFVGGRADWLERPVKKGDVVLDRDDNPVMDDEGKPRLHTTDDFSIRNLNLTPSDFVRGIMMKQAAKAAIKARFAGKSIFDMSRPSTPVVKQKEIENEEGIPVETGSEDPGAEDVE